MIVNHAKREQIDVARVVGDDCKFADERGPGVFMAFVALGRWRGDAVTWADQSDPTCDDVTTAAEAAWVAARAAV